jgi:hypothetical protein
MCKLTGAADSVGVSHQDMQCGKSEYMIRISKPHVLEPMCPFSHLLKGSLQKEFLDLFSHLLALTTLFHKGKAGHTTMNIGTGSQGSPQFLIFYFPEAETVEFRAILKP